MSKDYLAWSHDELLRRLLAQDAENDRLRAELAVVSAKYEFAYVQRAKAEARLAAVIALPFLEERTHWRGMDFAVGYNMAIEDIRAAATGETK